MAGCPWGIPAAGHLCYEFPAHCAAVEVESASLALGSKEDAMVIGFVLIIVAVFLCCALLFRLSIYALPLFVAFLAGSATYRTDSGILAALAAAAIAFQIRSQDLAQFHCTNSPPLQSI
jgi:hypothetical protein